MQLNIKYVNSILIKLDTQFIDFYLCIHTMGYLKDSIYLQDRGVKLFLFLSYTKS
jgi:hypothetical protein